LIDSIHVYLERPIRQCSSSTLSTSTSAATLSLPSQGNFTGSIKTFTTTKKAIADKNVIRKASEYAMTAMSLVICW
jgi:hypothetical protein